MNENDKPLKNDIISINETNVNFLSNILSKKDYQEFLLLKEELKDTWNKKQLFRTETEMRMSVLQDSAHPTKASKYWQCVREQSGFFESLMHLSFSYRRNEVSIKRIKGKIEKEKDPLKLEMLQISLEEKLFLRAHREQEAKDRMREIQLWSNIKKELNDGSFDDKDVNTHQAESYKKILENKSKAITDATSFTDAVNVIGQLQTLERLEKEGVLFSDSKKNKQIE